MSEREFAIPTRFELKSGLAVSHTYAAVVESVYDGDTIHCQIDLGFGHWYRSNVRLAGINAAEMRGPCPLQAQADRDFLRGLISGKWVVLHCGRHDEEKYGRVLARVYRQDAGKWIDVCDEMVASGHARFYLVERDSTREGVDPIAS